jgi:hypothetical protein
LSAVKIEKITEIAGFVEEEKKIKEVRYKPCRFVGYCLNHTGDTCNPETKILHLRYGIIWTGRMYFDSLKGLLHLFSKINS